MPLLAYIRVVLAIDSIKPLATHVLLDYIEFLKPTILCNPAANQPKGEDSVSREHPRRPKTEEARHHKGEGASWMGTKGQVERRASTHGGRLQKEARSSKIELRGWPL